MTPSTNGVSISAGGSLADLVEQLTARLQAGEEIDSAEIVAAHPEHADRLSGLLPALRAVAALGGSADSSGDECHSNLELGDFRIIRQVGRGGMGVVYEAEQLSLRRRVALKVLPFAATMDPKQLQRFRNEALAAASLHHEHIVPVFAVGCERGVHYYAMQFIEGTTLAAVIADFQLPIADRKQPDAPTGPWHPIENHQSKIGNAPTAPIAALTTEPTKTKRREFYRNAAEMIAHAADALEYAHTVGIVHRDIKPGNLLIDATGKLWVADFGLARFGPDAGLTMSGDLLGTLRYMAPEQALARHGLADHRVDVYGLGCTLYELLTGRPAVGGKDKADILRHIAFEEPVAPRKLDKSIPAELETIALKCLSKNPNERYATAGELAADLRRFGEDKPIKAKPPGVWERSAKWARRHRGFVAASFVILVVALAASSMSTFVIWRNEKKVKAANKDLARERDRAQANLRVARGALERVAGRLTDQLRNVPGTERVAADTWQEALRFFEILHQEQGSDPELRFEMAAARSSLGWLLEGLGRKEEAEAASRESVRSFEELAAEFPGEPKYRHMLAGTRNDLGIRLGRANRRAEADEIYRRAIETQESLVSENPSDTEFRTFLANMLSNRGILLCDMNQLAPAEQALRRSIALREELIREFPNDPDHQAGLCAPRFGLALMLNKLGRYAEAEQTFQSVVETQEKLVAGRSGDSEYRFALANTLKHQAHFFWDKGRLPEADAAFKKAIGHRQKLAAEFPNKPLNRSEFGKLLNSLGDVQAASRKPAEATASYLQAAVVWRTLIRDFPLEPDYRRDLTETYRKIAVLFATCPDPAVRHYRKAFNFARLAVWACGDFHGTLGVAHYRAGKWRDAVAELELSTALNNGNAARDQFFIAMAQWQLGNRDDAPRHYAQAVGWMETNKLHGEDFRRLQAEAAKLLGTNVNESGRTGTTP